MEPDDLVAHLSEAELEQAYREAGISFKVSSYMLLQMNNQVIIVLHNCQKQTLVRVQMHAQATSASRIQMMWRQHLEHKRYQALRQHPRAVVWREQSASVKAHLLHKVQDMQNDATWLQGRVQVLEEEKAEGQRQSGILQANGVILIRQVSDLTGQKAGLVGHIKEVEVRVAALEAQVIGLTKEVDHKERARVACEEQQKGHSAELQRMKVLIAQKDKESSARQGHMESLQKQLADTSSQVLSLTRQRHNSAVQGHTEAELQRMKVLIAQKDKESSARQGHMDSLQRQLTDTQVPLHVPSQLCKRSLLAGLKDRGKSSSPSQTAPGTPAQQARGADTFAVIDALLLRHASKDDTYIMSGLGVADEQPPPITSASQVGVISKEMMLCKPLGTTTLADNCPQGGSNSPTTADPAGTRAAGYSPQGDATSTMPLSLASQAASASRMPQGVPQLQERQKTVSTPQGVCRTCLTEFPGSYQHSICRNFAALKHGGRLLLDDLLQLDTRAQILTACAKVHCSENAASKFADGLFKAKQAAAEIAAREAAKGARRSAAASATVATSAFHAPLGSSSANGHVVSTSPPPALPACAPLSFGDRGANGGISGHDNVRRLGYGDDAATKQLPQLPSTAVEIPGLPVPSPAQSSALGKSSWVAVARGSATAQTGAVRRRQPQTAAQRGTPLQVRQQPRAQQPVGQGRASALGVGLHNIVGSNNCCVNVVVQVLRHCPALQTWLLNVALPDEYEGQEVVEELVRLFNSMDELAAAPQSMRAADPRGFRGALNGHFPQGPMLDAAEILVFMYGVLDNLAFSLSGLKLFHSVFQDHVFCPKCQMQTFVLKQTEYTLEAIASQLALREPPVRMGQHLFQTCSTQKSCNTDEGGCGDMHVVQHRLQGAPPAVVTVQLVWEADSPSSSAVQKTLGCIDLGLVLADVYPHLQRNTQYQLQEVVCFLGAHYVSYCRQPCGRWVKYDDLTVRSLDDWNAVCIDCRMGRCHPTILMYGTA
ncbi:hypothetical protein WJX77_009271 [Trebouxia sp. C0004]